MNLSIEEMAERSRALVESREYFDSIECQERLRIAYAMIQDVLTMPVISMDELSSIDLNGTNFHSFSGRLNGVPSRGRVVSNREGNLDIIIDIRYDTFRLRERQAWIEQRLGHIILNGD